MESIIAMAVPIPALTAEPYRGEISSIQCHHVTENQEMKVECNTPNINRVVMVNEHKESDEKVQSSKDSKLFWRRKYNSKSLSSSKRLSSNPSSSTIVLSTRKQHKNQSMGITLRQEKSNSGGKSPGVYLVGLAPHSPFRMASRFLPLGSKVLLVNGQPCPESVKEVVNRLHQVPQGAILTLHFEVDNKSESLLKKTGSKLSLFRRSNSMLNPLEDSLGAGADYAFYRNQQHIQQQKLPPSILKTPKYTSNALTSGCHVQSSVIEKWIFTPLTTAKVLHDEAILELTQLGQFFTGSRKTKDTTCTDPTVTLIEETNNRWAKIRADELAEF